VAAGPIFHLSYSIACPGETLLVEASIWQQLPIAGVAQPFVVSEAQTLAS